VTRNSAAAVNAAILLLGLGAGACRSGDRTPMPEHDGSTITVAPATMGPVDTVDDRYQSYNVEMLEVTGGKFWKPYGPELDSLLNAKPPASPSRSGHTPAGMNPAI
jgi:hypothetical protein